MTPSRLAIVVLFVVAVLSSASAADPKPAISPLGDIQWLIGDWHATAKAPDGTVTEIDNHIYWSETHTAIFFVTKFNGQPHYSGMYAYDTAHKTIGFWYVDVDGQFTQGTATPNGNRLTQKFEIAKLDGTTSQLTSILERRPGDASYHWQDFLPTDTSKPLIELDYTRK